jgi:CDP-diacylglycerol---serine O-phosphatidyltransferase
LLLLDFAENNHELHRWALLLPFLMVLIAVLMISTVRYPSGKGIDMQTKMRLLPFVGLLVVAALIYQFREIALVATSLSYILYGLVRHWRKKSANKGTQPPIPIKM